MSAARSLSCPILVMSSLRFAPGTYAWGWWVGMSYDGAVITGWGAIARTEEEANKVVQDLIDSGKS
jgi:hypothetical protein